ncbi:MAG: glycerol-3-phosphate 1-O-acyltransferase PlsY [bacterium]
MLALLILVSVAGFLIGGIPSGLLMGRLFSGADLRKSGSRNIGATNAFRVLGIMPGLLTLICDLLKGYLPLLILNAIIPNRLLLIFLGLATIIGHDFSPYLKFKGGKGVATSLGVFLFFSPMAILISLIFWIVVVALIRIVSLASIGAGLILPVTIYFMDYPRPVFIAAVFACFLLIFRHKKNIERLCRGEEKRLVRSKSKG